jgi:hypothetical protein
MEAVMIRDMVLGGGYLAVDLRHVLELLGERALGSLWQIEGLWYTDDTMAKQLEQLAGQEQPVSGRALKKAAEDVVQIIDGQFVAFEPGQSEPWVIVEAVDSTYYTVRSKEPAVLQSIRERFHDVSEYGHPDT